MCTIGAKDEENAILVLDESVSQSHPRSKLKEQEECSVSPTKLSMLLDLAAARRRNEGKKALVSKHQPADNVIVTDLTTC